MLRFSCLLLGVLLLAGCAGEGKKNLRYLGNSGDVKTMETPPEFAISPKEADDIKMKHRGAKVTVDDVYCDEECYYFIEGILGSKASRAKAIGTKIHGQTGKLFDPKAKKWIDVPRPKVLESSAASDAVKEIEK